MADQERSLPKEAERIAALDDRGLLRAALGLMVDLVNGVPPGGDRDWLLLRAGLWTGEVLRRGQADDPGPSRSEQSQAIAAQQEALEKVRARVLTLEAVQRSHAKINVLTPKHHVTALDLSARARQTLDRLAITSIAQLLAYTEDGLLAMKNVGQTTVNEIRSRLAEHGLALASQAP